MFVQTGVSCKWTNDSQRFLLEHFDTIYDSPSNIYSSALPFLPVLSWLREYYSLEFSLQVQVIKGLSDEWGTCSRVVSLDKAPRTLPHKGNMIAIGLWLRDIIIFDAITGSQTAVLSGHTKEINSLTFSSDGRSLVSGSSDTTIKLWDMQTGGVIKTLLGHSGRILSVSISVDCSTIASGSGDKKIHLWDIQTEECYCVIDQESAVMHISFSPTNPQYLISVSSNQIWQWDTNGHQISPTYGGTYVAFSPSGTQFALCQGQSVTIKNSDSRVTVAEFQSNTTNRATECCCFSPDGKLVAVAVDETAYIWDITSPEPHLVKTCIGHTKPITSLAFSSPFSLISLSENDKSIRFWQIGASPTKWVVTDPKPIPSTSASITSFILQAKDGIVISRDSDGVVMAWDISTGLCTASFQTPAKDSCHGDVQLIDGKLISVWYADKKIHIQNTEKGELLLLIDGPGLGADKLKISGDGSKIFCLYNIKHSGRNLAYIQAWSIQTGEVVDKVEIGGPFLLEALTSDNSRAWANNRLKYWGWDFGTPGSSATQLFNIPPHKLHSSGAVLWDIMQSRIQDKATGKVVFQLPRRFGKSVDVQWKDQYLTICLGSGEVLILDFGYMFLHRNL